MTQQPDNEQMAETQQKRGRGPTKPYPMMPFEEVLLLSRGIVEYGVGGEIERLTLLGKLDLSPSSSKTRALIIDSTKYGLTVGSYNALIMKMTEEALTVLSPDTLAQAAKQKEFELAIGRFEEFHTVYQRLKEGRLRDEAVLRGELGRAGVSEVDRQKVAETFTANLRYLGLIETISGSDQVRSIGSIINKIPTHEQTGNQRTETSPELTTPPMPSPETTRQVTNRMSEPTVHINVQIHIDSNATPEQIDQIFASMARHLYGREG